jgi:hypothetical protein
VLKRWETTIKSSHGIVPIRLGPPGIGGPKSWRIKSNLTSFPGIESHYLHLCRPDPSSWLSRKNILASGEFDHQNATR